MVRDALARHRVHRPAHDVPDRVLGQRRRPTASGEYAPIPPVFGPCPRRRCAWSPATAPSGTTVVADHTSANAETSGPSSTSSTRSWHRPPRTHLREAHPGALRSPPPGRRPPSRPCRRRSPSAFTTARPPSSSTNVRGGSDVGERARTSAVGMPCRTISSFAHDFEPSIRAASARDRRPGDRAPSARRRARRRAEPPVPRPSGRRRSRSTSATMPGEVVGHHGSQRATDAIPAFPGATSSVVHERALRQPPREGVLAAASADDEDLHPTGRLCSRAGPIETTDTGTPTSSSSRWTYARASFGRSSNDVASSISSIHPSSSS